MTAKTYADAADLLRDGVDISALLWKSFTPAELDAATDDELTAMALQLNALSTLAHEAKRRVLMQAGKRVADEVAKSEPSKPVTVPAGMSFDELRRTLTQMTSQNDHSGAVLMLVRAFVPVTTDLVPPMETVYAGHRSLGHLSPALSTERNRIHDTAMERLAKVLSPSMMAQLRKCF